jgi:hypothetical protein
MLVIKSLDRPFADFYKHTALSHESFVLVIGLCLVITALPLCAIAGCVLPDPLPGAGLLGA